MFRFFFIINCATSFSAFNKTIKTSSAVKKTQIYLFLALVRLISASEYREEGNKKNPILSQSNDKLSFPL